MYCDVTRWLRSYVVDGETKEPRWHNATSSSDGIGRMTQHVLYGDAGFAAKKCRKGCIQRRVGLSRAAKAARSNRMSFSPLTIGVYDGFFRKHSCSL